MGLRFALTAMTLDDLEHPNRGFMDFWWFWAARHISRANCAEIARDRQKQAAYKIFSVECRFQWSKFRPLRFEEICARGHQKRYPIKVVILPLGQSFMQNACR